MYPPSMIAAGSVSAAANGLLGHEWVQKVCLMDRLQQITGIDMVCIVLYLSCMPSLYFIPLNDSQDAKFSTFQRDFRSKTTK